MAMPPGSPRGRRALQITRVIRAAGDDPGERAVEGGSMFLTDVELVTRLRAGDEGAFMALVERYGPLMFRIALSHVPSAAVAEEVVQESWLGVLAGIDRFEGRSSLKTWILRILTNRAKTRGERERRTVPFSCLAPDDDDAPAVDPDRFQGPEDRYPGGWASFPDSWPEERLLARETLDCVQDAIRELPARQQDVIVLRDVEGWSSEEVCEALDLSEGNQRVLLHRARSRVREALERYFDLAAVAA
jgi:RNA polymerase sigma-70 factor (ECF subfamily)